jgi:hypothetical protein
MIHFKRSAGSESGRSFLMKSFHATADLMLAELRLIFPHLDLSQWRYLPCATCHTPDARPIVDVICGGRVGLLLGGNGYAGKSGDALGGLGAALLLGETWQGPIAREDLFLPLNRNILTPFNFIFGDKVNSYTSSLDWKCLGLRRNAGLRR